MRYPVFSILCLLIISMVNGQQPIQEKNKKGILYFSAGTHRAFYTPSNIRFVSHENPGFDFTLKNVRARDDQGFRFHSSPQYTYNLGYYSFKKKLGIEFQFDHLKYIMRQDQIRHLTGRIDNSDYDQDTLLHAGFIQFEHTDGANYAMLNLMKWMNISSSHDQKRSLDLFVKAGGGVVVPKTNSTIMGRHYDDEYAISGFVLGVEPGIRYNFLKNVFTSASVKGAFANYNRFRIAEGYGSQKWFSIQFTLMAGIQFPM